MLSGVPSILGLFRARRIGEAMLLGFGVLAILIVLITAFRQKRLDSLGTIRQTVERVNSRLTLTGLEPGGAWVGDRPRASYMIVASPGHEDAVYLFNPYEYTIDTGRDQSKVPTRLLCQQIQELRRTGNPILDGLRDAEWTVSLGEGPGSVEWKAKLDYVAEVLYTITELVGLHSRRGEILIQGFADGQRGPWERPLKSESRYQFRSIEVYPPLVPAAKNDPRFSSTSTMLSIGNSYDNAELPDLRAEFVRRDLIEPYLAYCPPESPVDVRILKGTAFVDPDQPQERKVQVQINLY